VDNHTLIVEKMSERKIETIRFFYVENW
jgi:hypothetical protein